jgi:HEAT repeat protein
MSQSEMSLKTSLAGAPAKESRSASAGSLTSNKALEDAFGFLSTYDWGHDRKRLEPIDQAINATAGDAPLRRALEEKLLAVLRSDAPPAAKDYVCRKLGLIGTEKSIPVLAALLPDEDLSHMARYALERMPLRAAGGALRDALGKVGGKTKVGIINSLGMREDNEAVDALIGLLQSEDIEIAGAAASALGRAGTPEAARALSGFLVKAPEPLRVVATDAALDAAQRMLREGHAEESVKIYRWLLMHGKAPHVRLAAKQGLRRAGKPPRN